MSWSVQSAPIDAFGPTTDPVTVVPGPSTSGPTSCDPVTTAPSSTTTAPVTAVAESTLPRMSACCRASIARLASSRSSARPVSFQ